MAHEIYICHSSNDHELAEEICSFFEKNNYKCWIAPRDIKSSNYQEEINNAILNSEIILLIFSAYLNSSIILSEIGLAFSFNKPFILMRTDDAMPENEMLYFLKNAHWIDAVNMDNTVFDSLLSAASKFLTNVSYENNALSDGVSKQPGKASNSEIYEINSSTIFLSYDGNDKESIALEVEKFKNQGYVLSESVDKSDCCIVFISHNSNKSCLKDIEAAFDNDIPVILVYLEDVQLKFGLKFKIKYKSKIKNLSRYSIKKYSLDDMAYFDNYVKFFEEIGV